MPTPEQERERIAGVYAAMSEGELEKVAAAGYKLGDVAHQALEAELARRGLSITIAPDPGVDVVELNQTVTVGLYRDLPEALLAKGALDSAGIQSHLVDDNMVRLDWFYSNLLGGIKIRVRSEDSEAATEILNHPIPETFPIDNVEEYQQPRCPKCQSLDVNFRELNKLVSYGSAYFGVPIPVHMRAWFCHACKHEWKDESGDSLPTEESL